VFLLQPHANDDLRYRWDFVLFAASKADGGIKTFGWVLAIWLFVIAAFIPIAGAYVTLAGLCPMEDILHYIRQGHEQHATRHRKEREARFCCLGRVLHLARHRYAGQLSLGVVSPRRRHPHPGGTMCALVDRPEDRGFLDFLRDSVYCRWPMDASKSTLAAGTDIDHPAWSSAAWQSRYRL
jgi:hypothetical protein